MNTPAKFMIHMQGAFYSNELYDVHGKHVYTLTEAIAAAKASHGRGGWEVYNGNGEHNAYYSDRTLRRHRQIHREERLSRVRTKT